MLTNGDQKTPIPNYGPALCPIGSRECSLEVDTQQSYYRHWMLQSWLTEPTPQPVYCSLVPVPSQGSLPSPPPHSVTLFLMGSAVFFSSS